MFDTVFGLPVHPLVVHAVVVLVPLSALGVIVAALNPVLRDRYGVLVFLVATAGLVAVPVATRSGIALEERLFGSAIPAAVYDHQRIGSDVLWFVLAMWAAMGALLLLDRDRNRRQGVGGPVLPTVVAVVAVLAALIAAGQVVRAGWTGAEARWDGVVQAQPAMQTQP
jgi:hypothetical protein